jgi:hypothetical protein
MARQRFDPSVRMRYWVLPAAVLSTMLAASAHAETPIRAGLWEKSEKVTLDGKALPPRLEKICLKADDANLERILLITADEAVARGCGSSASPSGSGIVRMNLSCPPDDDTPAVDMTLTLKVSPTSFEGTGTVEIKPRDGQASHRTSVLAGKRLGDC